MTLSTVIQIFLFSSLKKVIKTVRNQFVKVIRLLLRIRDSEKKFN